jgi:hypothetical protein
MHINPGACVTQPLPVLQAWCMHLVQVPTLSADRAVRSFMRAHPAIDLAGGAGLTLAVVGFHAGKTLSVGVAACFFCWLLPGICPIHVAECTSSEQEHWHCSCCRNTGCAVMAL